MQPRLLSFAPAHRATEATQDIPFRKIDHLAYEVLEFSLVACVDLCHELLGFHSELRSCRRNLVLDRSEMRLLCGNKALHLLRQRHVKFVLLCKTPLRGYGVMLGCRWEFPVIGGVGRKQLGPFIRGCAVRLM